MPTNKNITLRYKILDQCLRNKYREYTFEDIKKLIYKELGTDISIRQLREDIKIFRKKHQAPIKLKREYSSVCRKCYYKYEDPNFSIFKKLSDNDRNMLKKLLELLYNYKETQPWLGEVITNLECNFNITPDAEKVVFFERTELQGIEYLTDIIKHTLNHQALTIVYRSFKGEEVHYQFSPYCVKQYNGRWFLFGYDYMGKQIANLALDRIQKLETSTWDYVENTSFDPREYFKDVIGVSVRKDAEPVDVILRFSGKRFPYVKTKPIHPSQEIVDEKKGIVKIHVKLNKELKQQIFSFMPQVTVLAPQELREEIIRDIQYNLNFYLQQNKESQDTKNSPETVQSVD